MFSQYVLFLLFPPLARPCTATREKIMIMITSKQLVITDFNTHLLAHSAVTNLNTEHPPAEAASRALVTLLATVERKLSRNRNVDVVDRSIYSTYTLYKYFLLVARRNDLCLNIIQCQPASHIHP